MNLLSKLNYNEEINSKTGSLCQNDTGGRSMIPDQFAMLLVIWYSYYIVIEIDIVVP